MISVTIGELAADGYLKFSDGYRTKRDELAESGYRIIRVADIKSGAVSLEGPDFVSRERRRAIGSKAGRSGDILLTTKGTVGRVAVYEGSSEDVVYSPQLCFFRVELNDTIDPRFLRYWFSSPEFVQQATYRKSNTDMADYINLSDIRSLRISLPPLGDQISIADVLGALDEKIAANHKLVRTADDLAVSIVRSGYVEGGEVQLGDVATITMGSSPPGDSYNEEGTGTVFYQGNRDFGFRSPANRVWTVDPKRVAQAGDTLLSVRAPVGELNIASEETCVGRGLAALRSTEGAPAVLYYRLKAAPRLWESYESGGTVFGSINGKELNALKIPALVNASALETSVSKLDRIIASAETESIQLAKIRDTLLPRLMSGELHARDAARIDSNAG